MATNSQKNSFVSIAEQISLLNANATEILIKLDKVVTSSDSSVNLTQTDENGNVYNYALPTVGVLQTQINQANENIKRLAGLNDNNVHIINGESTKKIYLSDLNREPNKIDSLSTVSTFRSTNNWFFESLMNPTIATVFDVTDKVGSDVDGVISRRYIVEFEKDENNKYTVLGEQARQQFMKKFVNQSDINLKDFIDWHTKTTNTGVVQNLSPTYDEQFFDFEYQEVKEYGTFSVLKQEMDGVNNKLWFHIYPYKYSTIDGDEKVLQKGDELILNKEDSVARWSILETSVASSNFRVRLEQIEGFDPIVTGANILRYYGNKLVNKEVKVTVGFDEYLVIFMKPTNSKNRIKGSVWSKGTGVYTNNLLLESDENVSMAQYYLDTVFDYGNLLKDMIQKQIPSKLGIVPNAPELLYSNFKVVQINKHVTNTSDSEEIADLHTSKITLKSKLEQVNSAITQKNQELSVKKYSSVAEKSKAQNELTKLVSQQESLTKNLASITSQIKSKTETVNIINPKYRIRGFWDIPKAQSQVGSRDQEVIQFKVQYRYSSKSGTENQTEGYTITSSNNNTKTGYFSNWKSLFTDIRTRAYDEETEKWMWKIEDVSDADIPNINQLDISITTGEKVEIRVKSISEVGYPDSILESEWSNVLTVKFPDELDTGSSKNEYILEEAKSDSVLIEFDQSLSSKGITRHVQDSFYLSEEYVAHKDDTIQSSFKDDQGNPYLLKEYLEYLSNRITTLENIINSTRGILKVTIFNGSDEIEIKNNSETNINLSLQNYGVTSDGVNYMNTVSVIKDFYIKITNLSSSSSSTLSFLVSDNYMFSSTVRQLENANLAALVDNQNDFVIQENGQWIYFCDSYQGINLYKGDITHNSSGQINIGRLQESTITNIGLSSSYINKNRVDNASNTAYKVTSKEWLQGKGVMGTCILPQVESIDDLIIGSNKKLELSNNESMIIPLNIYWCFKTLSESHINLSNMSSQEHNKSLRVRMYPSSIDRAFEFIVKFNIQNKNI